MVAPWHAKGCVSAPFCGCADAKIRRLESELRALLAVAGAAERMMELRTPGGGGAWVQPGADALARALAAATPTPPATPAPLPNEDERVERAIDNLRARGDRLRATPPATPADDPWPVRAPAPAEPTREPSDG